MDFAHFWFDQQAAEPFVGIGNSLRFRGAQTLNKATGGSGTASVWIKRSRLGTAQTVMGTVAFAANDTLNGSTALFRDPSAWMHVVISTSGTYVNGVLIGTGSAVVRGTIGTSFEGYLAEFHYIDGTALDPSSFGEFNADGVWVPKPVSIANYGTNGFYLDFSDPANIGADRSGNGNNFTATGFELTDTTNPGYDWMADSPTQNYSTGNPLARRINISQVTDWREANLRTLHPDAGGNTTYAYGSQLIAESGKYYWEVSIRTAQTLGANAIGVDDGTYQWDGITGFSVYLSDGNVVENSSTVATGLPTYTANDVIGVALDQDNSTIQYFKNGTAIANAFSLNAMAYAPFNFGNSNAQLRLNYGNRPFAYTPPAGFEPLQTQELPAVDITNPSDHFDVITDTGANILTAAQAKFPNGLWWIKDRANSNQHQLVDDIRAGNVALQSPAAGSETAYIAPTGNSVAWCWNAPEGFSNSAGTDGATIDCTGRRNSKAGFAKILYNGVYQANTKIAHGLTKAPEFIIVKNRDNSNWFFTYHVSLRADQTIAFNSNGQASTAANIWSSTRPTDTVFSVGTDDGSNRNGDGFIAYCWHSVPGYSAFGSYTGNNSTDGPFIYTGFKPAFVIIKRIDRPSTDGNWFLIDNKRALYNPAGTKFYTNKTTGEIPESNILDLLSNGFKPRLPLGDINTADNYIYAAFAESPFGGSNVSPTTAR